MTDILMLLASHLISLLVCLFVCSFIGFATGATVSANHPARRRHRASSSLTCKAARHPIKWRFAAHQTSESEQRQPLAAHIANQSCVSRFIWQQFTIHCVPACVAQQQQQTESRLHNVLNSQVTRLKACESVDFCWTL